MDIDGLPPFMEPPYQATVYLNIPPLDEGSTYAKSILMVAKDTGNSKFHDNPHKPSRKLLSVPE